MILGEKGMKMVEAKGEREMEREKKREKRRQYQTKNKEM